MIGNSSKDNFGQQQKLSRGLKNRHIQLMAIGGAIGTGLFLGSGKSIHFAGPSILFAYLITGVFAFSLCVRSENCSYQMRDTTLLLIL